MSFRQFFGSVGGDHIKDNANDDFNYRGTEKLWNYLVRPEPSLPSIPASIVMEVLGPNAGGPDFILEEAMFPKQFVVKKQVRLKGQESVQKLLFDEARLNLIFQNHDSLSWVRDVTVHICHDHTGNCAEITDLLRREIGNNTIRVEFDLNKVEDMEIYKLQKTTLEAKKKFHCSVKVTYINDNVQTKTTTCFVVLGTQPKPSKRSISECEEGGVSKRSKLISFDFESDVTSATSSIDSGLSSPITPGQAKIMAVSSLVAQNITTKTLEVDGTFYGKQIHTPRHDIGYHFKLRDDDETFEEGEVVGFLPVDDENVDADSDHGRRQVVTKLTYETADKTLLKGVVTREPYIEAYCPKEENTRSEVICMMGIVPVQVIGSVRTNEILYSSRDYPGKAVSGDHLPALQKKGASFVGIAFSSRMTKNEESVGFVEAGVSLLQEASQVLVNQKLRDMEKDIEGKIQKVKKSHKRWRKCTIVSALLFIISLALLGIYLWQEYQPGSALRFARCRNGHKKPLHKAWFTYIPTSNIYETVKASGIEFDFDVLMKKLNYEKVQRIPEIVQNVTVGKARYYLNIERCAYGNDIEYTTSDGRVIYRGTDMFAIDEKCFYVFYHWNNKNKWAKYYTADWKRFKNVFCSPPSPFKNESAVTGRLR